MAHATLLSLIKTACYEMGVTAPASIMSSADTNALQLLALANREGKECARAANAASGWQTLRTEYTFNVQSTGMILGCSYTNGSNVITIGTPPTQAPQIGWTIATSGGSNATGFSYPTLVTGVAGNQITVNTPATSTVSNTSMAFGQETYALPADFDYMINQTMWDRGYRWQVFGGLTPQEWQVLKSGLSPTGPRRRFRIMDGALHLDPIPYDSNLLVYEYYSTNFALTIGTTPASSFTTDTDTYQLLDDLLVMGIMWRWKRAKGLDYSEEYKTYSDALQRELGRDATARPLRLDVITPDVALLTSNQVPDTGFGTGS